METRLEYMLEAIVPYNIDERKMRELSKFGVKWNHKIENIYQFFADTEKDLRSAITFLKLKPI